MLIGTFQKRPNDEIELPPRVYYFKPILPDDPNSIHVCEVTDKAHIERLLSIKESFFKMDKNADPHQLPTRDKPAPINSQRQTPADQILHMTLRGLRDAMKPPHPQFTPADLREALQIERGKSGNERRDATIALIEQFLTGAEIAERRNDNPAVPKATDTGSFGNVRAVA